MSEPFLGEIRMYGFNFAPRNWAACNGQLLPINQNQALFSILGITYGGNGQTTFALPDLRGRTPVHVGNGVTLGQSAGEETHTLTVQEIPQHMHSAFGSSTQVNQLTATGNVWGTSPVSPYAAQSNVTLSTAAIGVAGSSQGHENRQPYRTVNFCIALTGYFPSRD
ncbi:MAG: Tail Collar domain protein [Symbiobacteriaceae bacterium]|jgi:microcystin-dependent protein|nr:Tail Collar domain protein [Symbiobacteriaceae bacterium]